MTLRRRVLLTVLAFGLLAAAACLLAPMVGSRPDFAAAGVRPQRSRSPTTSTRRSSSSPGCRGRWPPRSSARRSPRRASCSRRCSATRSPRRSRWACRRARRSARCCRLRSRSRSRFAGVSTVPVASFAGALGAVAIVYVLSTHPPPRPLDQRAAAGRRHAQRVLLGAHPLRAVPRRLLPDDAHGAVADGRPGRRQLRADRGGAAVHDRWPSRCSPGCRGRSTC